MNGRPSPKLLALFLFLVLLAVVLAHSASAEVTGNVVSVSGRSVEIKLDGPGNVRPGDRVELSYVTAAGASLSVGTWRVRTVKGNSVTADPVNSPTAPVAGLKATLFPAEKADTRRPGKPPQPGGRPQSPPVAAPPVTPAAAVWLGFDIGVIEGAAGGSGGILDSLQSIFSDNKGGRTAVAYVYTGSPAYNAGLKVQDIILEVNGKPAGSPADISRLVHQMKPGTPVSFAVERKGSRIPVTMTVEPLPQYMVIADRAKKYYDASRFADAIKEYSRAIELKNDVPEFYFYRGFCQYTQNQFNTAEGDFTRSIELNPQSPTAYAFRGLVRALMAQFDAAIADYDTALKIGPQASWIFRQRAIAHAVKGQFGNALSDMDRAIEVSPQDPAALSELYFERAKILTDLKRPDDAMTDINKAIELGKTNAQAYGYRCHLFNLKKDYRQALADCNRSIDLDRNLFATYVTRAETYEALGNNRQALADMRQALALRPQEKYVQEHVKRLTAKASGNR